MVAAVALFTNLSKKPATSIRKPSLQRAATSSQWPPKPWYSQSKDRPLTTEILVGSVTMWKGAQERELRIWEEAFPQLAEEVHRAGWVTVRSGVWKCFCVMMPKHPEPSKLLSRPTNAVFQDRSSHWEKQSQLSRMGQYGRRKKKSGWKAANDNIDSPMDWKAGFLKITLWKQQKRKFKNREVGKTTLVSPFWSTGELISWKINKKHWKTKQNKIQQSFYKGKTSSRIISLLWKHPHKAYKIVKNHKPLFSNKV